MTLDPKDRQRAVANAAYRVRDLERALAASGNYVANSEINPTSVTFANGRTVSINAEGFLEIGWSTPPIAGAGEELVAWLTKASSAIYLACDGPVADDISPKLKEAATSISQLYSRIRERTAERDRQYDENVNRIAAQGAAEAKLAEARDVLEPFAKYIKVRDLDDADIPDPTSVISYATSLRGPVVAVTFGDFRRARSFHSPKEPDGGANQTD